MPIDKRPSWGDSCVFFDQDQFSRWLGSGGYRSRARGIGEKGTRVGVAEILAMAKIVWVGLKGWYYCTHNNNFKRQINKPYFGHIFNRINNLNKRD
jgi:hypothetical protein